MRPCSAMTASIVTLHVTAVGVEIDAGSWRRRDDGQVLGVLDRVELRRMDARDLYPGSAAFDTAQWSQFFFPTEGRPEILAALFRALSGGLRPHGPAR